MAKKKKSKKHNFSYAKPSGASAKPAVPTSTEPTQKASKPVAAPSPVAPSSYDVTHLQQIKGDVRGVLILAASFVALQLVLWFILEHTSVGTSVYSLIKL